MKKSKIKLLREKRKLSYGKVRAMSEVIAEREKDKSYIVSKSRMVQIEQGSQPGFHKMYALAEIFGMDPMKLQKIILEGKGN